MGALDLPSAWPVPNAAAGVASADAVLGTTGDSTRRFRLASVTKLLTALAALVAIEERTIALDEPAGPEGSTVRHLLAHTSGLSFDGDEPVTAPGRRRIYSNTGFERLGDHLGRAAGMPFADYLDEAVLEPLGMTTTRLDEGSPAAGAWGSLDDVLRLGRELLVPTLVAPDTLAAATAVHFPGLSGVLPGFGRQSPCDWGLGFELRDDKSPHWTGDGNSPRTFGHFGGAGAFLWVDPAVELACAALADREFGEWAMAAWPVFSDAVLAEFGA